MLQRVRFIQLSQYDAQNTSQRFAFTGYAPLIRAYVAFILSKLRFHRHHPEFNGLFEYEEYVSLKNIDDPNEGYVQIPTSRMVVI